MGSLVMLLPQLCSGKQVCVCLFVCEEIMMPTLAFFLLFYDIKQSSLSGHLSFQMVN